MLLYDAIRSSDPADFDVGGTCVASNIQITTSTDTAEPLPGSAFFYLIRAENACPSVGQGSLGADSDGIPRTGRTCP